MKKLAIILIALMFTLPIMAKNIHSSTKYSPVPDSVGLVKSDSTEYELTVFDTGFENWFRSNSRPMWYFENEYYRSKNNVYVSNWNSRVIQSMHRPPYENEIAYNHTIDYGTEVNWKLYWYFKYLEHINNISLGGGQ